MRKKVKGIIQVSLGVIFFGLGYYAVQASHFPGGIACFMIFTALMKAYERNEESN